MDISRMVGARFVDTPEGEAELRVLRTLEDALASTEREIDSATCDEYLRGHPQDKQARARRAQLDATLDAKEDNPPRSPDAGSRPPEVLAALAIAIGPQPPSAEPFADKIGRLREKVATLRAGIVVQTPVVDRVNDELSRKVALKVQTEHKSQILAIFRAAQALAAAVDAERATRHAVAELGFAWRQDICRVAIPAGATRLGSERNFDSDISRCRRQLEDWKYL